MKAQSKYRHIFGTPAKPEKCYTGLRIMNSAWDSNSMAASATLLAIPSQGGGGPVIITPHSRTGKQAENFSAAGHKGNVLDMAFSPFDERKGCQKKQRCFFGSTCSLRRQGRGGGASILFGSIASSNVQAFLLLQNDFITLCHYEASVHVRPSQ